MIEPARIIASARRLGIDALHAAVALDLVAPIAGRSWTAICCWCLDRDAPALADEHVFRLSYSHRSAGDCLRCPYTGPDVLVAAMELPR